MQIPENYEFLIYPKIVSGQCALENLPTELDGNDAQKPLVVTSQAVVRNGLAKILVKAFYDSAVVIGAIYDPVLDYAGISQAQQAARLFIERGCDAIIALGGGPVVALAKAVNVLVSERQATLLPYYSGAPIVGPLKPLIVVPSGAGDGQEAMPAMTVDNRVIISEALFPGVFVLDGRMTMGANPQVVAESGAIALAQAVTALTMETPNPMIDALAHPSLDLLARHLLPAVRHPKDKGAGLAVANAAVLASAAGANSGPGLVFMLGEALAEATGVSLGKCLGILLPFAMDALRNANRPVRDQLCLAMAGLEGFAAMPATERPNKGLEMAAALARELKVALPASLQALRVQRHLLDPVARAAAAKSAGRFQAAECRAILGQAWDANA
jgi:alcohol dehydrogenase